MSSIQHKHLMIRAECKSSPKNTKEEQKYLNQGFTELIDDLDMKVVLPARCYFVKAEGNDGWTGNVGLSTSHAAYHWWDKPDPSLLTTQGLSLVQFDVYTCGDLNKKHIRRCIEWIDDFMIVNLDLMFMDRAVGFNSLNHKVCGVVGFKEVDIDNLTAYLLDEEIQ